MARQRVLCAITGWRRLYAPERPRSTIFLFAARRHGSSFQEPSSPLGVVLGSRYVSAFWMMFLLLTRSGSRSLLPRTIAGVLSGPPPDRENSPLSVVLFSPPERPPFSLRPSRRTTRPPDRDGSNPYAERSVLKADSQTQTNKQGDLFRFLLALPLSHPFFSHSKAWFRILEVLRPARAFFF